MLRTTIAIALLILLFRVESSAQICSSYGVKMGVLYSNLYFGERGWGVASTRRMPGLGIAVFAEWLNMTNFSVITQLELTQRGSIIDHYSTEAFGARRIAIAGEYNRLHYLSAPILAKWTFTKKGLKAYFLLGPRVDYLLRYATDFGFLDPNYKEFKKVIVGGSAAIGCEAASLSAFAIVVEARYNFDFASSYVCSYEDLYTTIRKDAFDLWLGFAF
jgi:hypothetical protein